MDPRLDVGDGDSQRFANFVIRQPLDVAEHDGRPAVRRQFVDRRDAVTVGPA